MAAGIKVSPARRAAFDVLWRVAAEDGYASNLLSAHRYDELSREDHGLLQELTLGVLRWQGRLDFLIEHFTKRKLGKLDPEVVIALRLGLYQLLFLTRIPAHAAINESVNLVKERKKQSAAPLVNAVLRSAQRDHQPIPPIADKLGQQAVLTSHPEWLLRRWIERFGEDGALALAAANNQAPRAAFRFNPNRASDANTRAWLEEHKIVIAPSQLAPHSEIIERGSLSPNTAPIRDGWIYLQDEASQLVAHLTAVNFKASSEHRTVLDLCAAPGGKTTLLASLLPKNALIVAGDLHLHRLKTMKELAARLGIDRINLVQLDATNDLPFSSDFDLVLLDAPCSGLGTLQRHPEIKWRMNPEKIRELAELQKQLIINASQRVRIGGLLAYSVCSTEPEEAEEVIAWFRQNHPEYRDVTRERLVELGLDPAPLLTSTFGARTFPHRQGSEGFFVCVLWKRRRNYETNEKRTK